MNREQMEAWCALEGLVPAKRRHMDIEAGRSRVIPLGYTKGMLVLQWISGKWLVTESNQPAENYYPCQWEDLHPEAYDKLTIELLTELTKQ